MAKKKETPKTFTFLIEGLVRVWHKGHSFIISEKDNVDLSLDQLEDLVSKKENGELKEVHPLNPEL